jgi:putative ABC transport system ATP-binding protein
MEQVTISCKGIKKSYGEGENRVDALKGIDLDIHESQLTLLVGPSGSGKTTLLSIITTILTPDEGQLFLLDQDIKKMTKKEKALFCRHTLGIVFQSLFLVPTLTVAENVTLPLLVAGFSQEAAMEKAITTLKQMNLAHRCNISPAILSKGQQQRVAVARALINDAKILVCDEPTSSLDQASGVEVMTFLRELALHSSRTILVVTHDHRIFPFADRIVEMSDGQIMLGKKNE